MIIGMQGSRSFGTRTIDDYPVFLSAMLRVLQKFPEGDNEIVILTAGPHRINEMIYEFINVSDWKSRGIKTKVVKMPAKALAERLGSIDEFVYICRPKEPESWLCKEAEDKELVPQISRYP
jgi:hypothetical protein